jgi:hypothetical protein
LPDKSGHQVMRRVRYFPGRFRAEGNDSIRHA